MRRILVDHARARRSQKRGGPAVKVTFDEALVVTNEPCQGFVALDEALDALAQLDERKSKVIELRYFGGLTVEETATVLKVSLSDVDPSTMHSRRCPGLYLVGEMLEVDGRLGGFNFQWAWASAMQAALGICGAAR